MKLEAQLGEIQQIKFNILYEGYASGNPKAIALPVQFNQNSGTIGPDTMDFKWIQGLKYVWNFKKLIPNEKMVYVSIQKNGTEGKRVSVGG